MTERVGREVGVGGVASGRQFIGWFDQRVRQSSPRGREGRIGELSDEPFSQGWVWWVCLPPRLMRKIGTSNPQDEEKDLSLGRFCGFTFLCPLLSLP